MGGSGGKKTQQSGGRRGGVAPGGCKAGGRGWGARKKRAWGGHGEKGGRWVEGVGGGEKGDGVVVAVVGRHGGGRVGGGRVVVGAS